MRNQLNIHCFSCDEKDHFMDECPLIHYVPRKINIIKRYLASDNQERLNEYKRKSLKYNALIKKNIVQKNYSDFLYKLPLFMEESGTVHESECSNDDIKSESSLNENKSERSFKKENTLKEFDNSFHDEEEEEDEEKKKIHPPKGKNKAEFVEFKSLKNAFPENSNYLLTHLKTETKVIKNY